MPLVLKRLTGRQVFLLDKDFDYTIVEPPIDPMFIPAPYEGDDEMLKHEGGGHDQKTHGNWATGGEISTWNPKDPIPESPRNAGGMTAKSWEAWEHGPDGQNFIALFRKYAAEELGLEVPKTPFDQGGYLNYMMDRGWGKPSREEAKGMLNAIANGKPQPALYRGMTDSTDPEEQKSFDALLSTKPGDTFDMPLVSTTRSVGVATWYAADVAGVGKNSVVLKIQEGAKGVSLKKENSVYPQDHEVITSGKFEVVSVSKVSIPYWSRGIFEPRKVEYKPEYGGTRYEVATYSKKEYSEAEAKIAYEAVQSGNLSSLETPDFKLTDDRGSKGSLSSWTREPAKEFTVIEVKMVEPHTVQKAKDYGNEFFFLFNNMPFIHDDLEDVAKHGSHDQKTHGNWASGNYDDLAQWYSDEMKVFGTMKERDDYFEEMLLSQRKEGFTEEKYPEFRRAIGEYESALGYSLNDALRDPQVSEKSFKDTIEFLDKAIETAPPLREEVIAYRGIKGNGLNFFEKLTVGDVFEDKGYVSTTIDAGVAQQFGTSGSMYQGLAMRLRLPAGSKGIFPSGYKEQSEANWDRNAGEAEFLLPRGSKFKVTAIRGKVWDVELIP
jgi:hypothetical protein